MFLFLYALTGITLVIAGYSDLKKREIPDYVNFSFLAIAAMIRLIWSISDQNFTIIAVPAVLTVIVFIVTYIMYAIGHWGGGDTKLTTASAMALGWFPDNGFFFVQFIINLLFSMVVYSTVFVIYIAMKNRKKVLENYGNLEKLFTGIVWLLAGILLFTREFHADLFIFVAGLVMAGLIPLIIIADRHLMVASVSPSKLTLGDWLIEPVNVGRKIIKPRKIGLIEKDLEILKKYKGKIMIKNGIPLAPAFLIAFLLMFMRSSFANILFPI